ncbi:MAG: DUF1905 domain-containing protein [Actinobacteria bacterium]|nr:DUF1905 domain-containing protein [Actinomycetota bacterium]
MSRSTPPQPTSAYAPIVFRFDAEVWLYADDGGWHFLTVPAELSEEIEVRTSCQRRGFGSVRVRVTIGVTSWTTSVFPDKKRGAYVLPVKKDVRRAEDFAAGDRVDVTLELLDA